MKQQLNTVFAMSVMVGIAALVTKVRGVEICTLRQVDDELSPNFLAVEMDVGEEEGLQDDVVLSFEPPVTWNESGLTVSSSGDFLIPPFSGSQVLGIGLVAPGTTVSAAVSKSGVALFVGSLEPCEEEVVELKESDDASVPSVNETLARIQHTVSDEELEELRKLAEVEAQIVHNLSTPALSTRNGTGSRRLSGCCSLGGCSSTSYSTPFGTVSIPSSASCAIRSACQSLRLCDVVGLACDGVGTVLGHSVPWVYSEVNRRAPSYVYLNTWEKTVLSCHFANKINLSKVRVHYNTRFLNELEFGSGTQVIGFPVDAQTFYYDIFFSGGPPTTRNLWDHINTLAHELQHTWQYAAHDAATSANSYSAFGVGYFTAMCNAGMSYDNNPYEIAARKAATAFAQCYTPSGTKYLITLGSSYMVPKWSASLNRYYISIESTPSEDSVWEIHNYCIKNVQANGYLGVSTTDGVSYLTLRIACSGSREWWYRSTQSFGNCFESRALSRKVYLSWIRDDYYSLSYTGCTAYSLRAASTQTQGLGLAGSSSSSFCSLGSCSESTPSVSFSPSSFGTSCSAGEYIPSGADTCSSCPVGRYSSGGTVRSCSACSAGRYASTTGRSSCSQCPRDQIAPTSGASQCESCPEGEEGNSERTQCVIARDDDGSNARHNPIHLAAVLAGLAFLFFFAA